VEEPGRDGGRPELEHFWAKVVAGDVALFVLRCGVGGVCGMAGSRAFRVTLLLRDLPSAGSREEATVVMDFVNVDLRCW
jgi:hypothetical protein